MRTSTRKDRAVCAQIRKLLIAGVVDLRKHKDWDIIADFKTFEIRYKFAESGRYKQRLWVKSVMVDVDGILRARVEKARAKLRAKKQRHQERIESILKLTEKGSLKSQLKNVFHGFMKKFT